MWVAGCQAECRVQGSSLKGHTAGSAQCAGPGRPESVCARLQLPAQPERELSCTLVGWHALEGAAAANTHRSCPCRVWPAVQQDAGLALLNYMLLAGLSSNQGTSRICLQLQPARHLLTGCPLWVEAARCTCSAAASAGACPTSLLGHQAKPEWRRRPRNVSLPGWALPSMDQLLKAPHKAAKGARSSRPGTDTNGLSVGGQRRNGHAVGTYEVLGTPMQGLGPLTGWQRLC